MTLNEPIDCGKVSEWKEMIPEAFRYHAMNRVRPGTAPCYVETVTDWSKNRPREVKVCYTCNILWECDEKINPGLDSISRKIYRDWEADEDE